MIDWRLDTRNKKPKVYNVAILTAVLLVLLTIVFLLQKVWMVRFSCLLLALYFLVFAALLLRGFFWQIRYNLYSYNTIIYFGFSLFSLFLALAISNLSLIRHEGFRPVNLLGLALAFARAQLAETRKEPIFVLSGGKGADECISEAECMRRYLIEQGIPEELMLLEDKSADTAENTSFCLA